MIVTAILLLFVLDTLWIAYEMKHAPIIEEDDMPGSDEEKVV